MNEEQKIPDWKDLPSNVKTKLRKLERRRGVLVWNSKKQGTLKKNT